MTNYFKKGKPVNLSPGRELDALIAEKVMECKVKIHRFGEAVGIRGGKMTDVDCGCDNHGHADIRSSEDAYWDLAYYSTNIGAAKEVQMKLQESYEVVVTGYRNSHYFCELYKHNSDDHNPDISVDGDTEAHAICLAALKAVGAEK